MIITFENLEKSDLIPGYIYKAGNTNNYLKNEVIKEIFKFKNLKGIGTQSGIRRTMIQNNPKYNNEEAFCVLINNKSTEHNQDWPNAFNSKTNILTYYGDNNNPEKHYLDTKQKGNLTFRKYFQRTYSKSLVANIAPFFYFERVNGNDRKFIGLAVPYINDTSLKDVLSLKVFTSNNAKTFENYVAKFTILTDVIITRDWLYDLKVGTINSNHIPIEWATFLSSRKIYLSHETFKK